ncbi:MAG: trigger factor [Chloroflexi bacterium]|nr:trigger factor [Chloroflexota bacterium]
MKVTTESIPDRQVVLTVEVEPDRVEKYLDRAYRRLVDRINIPGFRKGKAPRYIVERMMGKEMLFSEGLDLMFPDVYKTAVDEAGVKPFDAPKWEVAQENPLVLKITVSLEPTVELGNYKDIRLAREEVEVTDEQVQYYLDQLRERYSEWVPVERPAAIDDRVTIDISGATKGEALLESAAGSALVSQEGKQIINTKGVDYPVKPQPDSLLPGFAEQLVGLAAGQEKEFSIILPTDYPEADLVGKEALFKVVCHAVKEKHSPELDDEFAKTIGDFETIDAARQSIREGLLERAKAAAEGRFADTLVNMIVDRSRVELPPSLIDREEEHAIERFAARLRESGLMLDQYLRSAGQTEEQYKETVRASAKKRLETAFVLREVAEAENIEVKQEEVDEEIHRLADNLADEDAARARNTLGNPEARSSLSYDLWERKVMNRLTEIATSETTPEEASDSESPVAAEQTSEANPPQE